MADRLLIIEQVAHEDPGVFGKMAAGSKFEPVYARMYAGDPVPSDPEGFAGILVMGGPMNVDQTESHPWLAGELQLIAAAAGAGVPVLGICLGSQLIAAALGGRVYGGSEPEIGWYGIDLTVECETDMLFDGFPRALDVFQWHGQTFDLPPGAALLAGSPLFPHQAFRAGDCVWGVQFHLEVTADMVGRWLEVNSSEVAAVGVDAEAVLVAADGKLANLAPWAEKLFGRFLELCGSRNAGR